MSAFSIYKNNMFSSQDLKALADHGGKTITIIGGGLTGCELASILSLRTSEEGGEGNRVIHLVREGSVLEKYIPKYLGDFVAPQLQQSVRDADF